MCFFFMIDFSFGTVYNINKAKPLFAKEDKINVNRIKQLRKEKALTLRQFGSIFKVAESTVSHWEHGIRQPDLNTLIDIAAFFNVSIDYLIGNDVNPKDAKKKSLSNSCEVIQYNLYPVPLVKLSWRGGEIKDDDVEEYVYMKQKNKNDHFALRFTDDSMVNVGIRNGSILIVHIQSEAKDGDIIAALMDGKQTVRRYREKSGAISLISEGRNPDFEPITQGTEFKILGKVIEVHTTL